jgi:hypothetical protein
MAHADADHERADHGRVDQGQAAREADARRRLLAAGGAALPRAPWRAGRQPPSATDLIQFTLWRSHAGGTGDGDLLAALALLPAARAEADQVEAALLFTARARGLSWARISRAIGLGSPQAAQQRLGRITSRAPNGAS